MMPSDDPVKQMLYVLESKHTVVRLLHAKQQAALRQDFNRALQLLEQLKAHQQKLEEFAEALRAEYRRITPSSATVERLLALNDVLAELGGSDPEIYGRIRKRIDELAAQEEAARLFRDRSATARLDEEIRCLKRALHHRSLLTGRPLSPRNSHKS